MKSIDQQLCMGTESHDRGIWLKYYNLTIIPQDNFFVQKIVGKSLEDCQKRCLSHVFCRSFSYRQYEYCLLHYHNRGYFKRTFYKSTDYVNTYEWHTCSINKSIVDSKACIQRPYQKCKGYWSQEKVSVDTYRMVDFFPSLSSRACQQACLHHWMCSEVLYNPHYALCLLQSDSHTNKLELPGSNAYSKGFQIYTAWKASR